jgi:ketosteroid isomerase-like protein
MIGAMLLRAGIPASMKRQSEMDLEGMSKHWADDVVLELSGPSNLAGRHEGRAAVEEFFRRDWDQLESSHIRAVRIGLTKPFAFGLTNVALVQFVADVTSKDGLTGRIEGVSVVEVRKGKTVAIKNHYFDAAEVDRIYRSAVGLAG